MSKNTKIIAFAILVSLTSCQTMKKVNTDISKEELYSHVDFLASDSLQGRFPGTPYDRVAAKYIKDNFDKSKLELLGEKGYQFFDLIIKQTAGQNNLLEMDGVNYKFNQDFSVFPFSSSSTLDANVVYTGYGFNISSGRVSWNDYSQVNVKDKWVLILRGDPEPDSTESVFATQSSDRNKVLIAKDMGAKGVLLVSGVSFDPKDQLVGMDERGYDIGIPVIHVNRKTANAILRSVKIEDLEKNLLSERKPNSVELDSRVKGSTEVLNDLKTSQNVASMFKGSDERCSNQYIVIGAHFDHLGMGGKGSSSRMPDSVAVHNGADDNASGVAAMLEIAQKLSANKKNLKRSFVFVAFGAEEMGLIGSQKFVESNIIPYDSIVAMINIDMLGRMKNNNLQISGVKTSLQSEGILKELNSDSTLKLSLSPEGYGPSDHASFYNKNIPVFFVTTGVHLDYHTPTDDIGLINFDGMLKSTNYIYSLAEKIANLDEKLTFQQAGPKSQTIRSRKGLKVKLGIIPDVSGATNNGLRVIGATENNPAARAGIKAGDIITAINGKPVKNIQDYMFRLSELKPGMTVNVEIIRNAEKIVLLVQL